MDINWLFIIYGGAPNAPNNRFITLIHSTTTTTAVNYELTEELKRTFSVLLSRRFAMYDKSH